MLQPIHDMPPIQFRGPLVWLLKEAEKAGWGIANGTSFEAFPGCEDAAADFMEDLLNKLCGDDQ